MASENLKIGDEVYYNEKWSSNCRIGKIIGETPKYWRIQFGDNNSPDLFDKECLYMRGSDSWNFRKAYSLTNEKKKEIILTTNKTIVERRINNFLKVGVNLKNIDNGKKILGLADKIKEIIKYDEEQKHGE